MVVTAELPLIASAFAFALAAVILALPRRRFRWRARGAFVAGTAAAAIPLLLYPFRDVTRSAGRALWEWSAVGGPTVQAAYRFDGVAAVGIAAALCYTTAGLLAVQRASRRHQLLPAIVLANGFVAIALAVTDDLIAATVVLGVVAALTAFAQLIVAPAPASARLAGFYALGMQCFVVAALLISRTGAGSFAFGDIRPTAISPGVVLAASLGAALFAGLYPFIPWRYEGEQARAPEREPLRGLLAMPAGVGATVVLVRLLGSTEIELSTLGLPQAHPSVRIAAVAIVIASVLALVARRRPVPVPPLVVGGALLLAIALYPGVHWSHAVLVAALVSVTYAAAVSLVLPEQWEVVRYDVTLAGAWIGLAVGTPLSIAGALFLVLADAVASLVAAIWLPPHRWYIATVATSTAYVGGVLAIGAGIRGAADLVTQILAVIALVALLLLVLVHIGRALSEALVPTELDVSGGAVAFLGTALLALLAGTAIHAGLDETLGRPFGALGPAAPFVVPALAVSATLLVVVARTLRPFLPDLRAVAGRLRTVVLAVDPVPAVLASFRLLEAGAMRTSSVFGIFEQRGGVWLAALLIFALLLWATRA
ncbi:MAG TPA: hypothetical protein VFW12_05390 [Candidatus Limnocylindria bacterium]|nr:hypothetical protein [Candidatus Limnocylindria bacterium]